jgi:hypothetical protein
MVAVAAGVGVSGFSSEVLRRSDGLFDLTVMGINWGGGVMNINWGGGVVDINNWSVAVRGVVVRSRSNIRRGDVMIFGSWGGLDDMFASSLGLGEGVVNISNWSGRVMDIYDWGAGMVKVNNRGSGVVSIRCWGNIS